ncbi:MAG: hypothetical protein CL872_02950 [Dehalococcoidaceae bacterium]|nr:hypothetical protein [Dehalococcoidaceae bacterium]|tara:strand:+ start:936 stop:1763 length:828 start_codon:yes stop_codon:yes gene_type:complete
MLGSRLNIFNYRSFVLVMVIAIFFGNLVLILDSRDDDSSILQTSQGQIENLTSSTSLNNTTNGTISRSIQVTGFGEVSLEPNIATFSINVVTQRDNASLAREDSARKLNQLFASLKSFGIEQKDIMTTNYSLYPEYVYEKNKIRRIEAFNVSNNLNVKVRQLERLGSVIDGVIKLDSGDIRINNISFNVDNSTIYEDQARESAIKDAIAKASKIAKNANVQLGLPMLIVDVEPFSNVNPIGVQRAMMAEMDSTPTTIATGQIIIEANVQVTFEIK